MKKHALHKLTSIQTIQTNKKFINECTTADLSAMIIGCNIERSTGLDL